MRIPREKVLLSHRWIAGAGALLLASRNDSLFGGAKSHCLWGRSEKKPSAEELASKAGKQERIQWSAWATRGMRDKMEDEWVASNGFFGIFDGHRGPKVSHFVQENLLEIYERVLGDVHTIHNVGEALKTAFEEMSARVLADKSFDRQGSTAVTVVVQDDKIWTGNLGDSRAVLCRDCLALDITQDHKPNGSEERKRIERAGGHVRWYGYTGPDRQPAGSVGVYRIDGNLAVSRAFGDKDQRDLISHDVDVRCFERDRKRDQFIILASDGLWDVLSSQAAVNFVQRVCCVGNFAHDSTSITKSQLTLLKENISKFLVEEAIRCGSVDNVTCIVVWLQ